jgi:uncharacterized coiled-coil protein SlyX
MGFTSGRARVRAVHHLPAPPPSSEPDFHSPASSLFVAGPEDDLLDIEPLLDRLERVEARMETIEHRPAPSPALPSNFPECTALLADLDRRVEENTRELVLLRDHVTEAERRVQESVASLERSAVETREEIPALVERSVAARLDDLRGRFGVEMEHTHERTLATFERTIDEKISSRIGAIEKALAEQAASIDTLSLRATETDNNLQRLVAAIEKLCERAQLLAPEPGTRANHAPIQIPRQNEPRLPLESRAHDAIRQAPVQAEPAELSSRREDPITRTEELLESPVAAPAFTGRETAAPKKSRFLFRNLIFFGLSLLVSRLAR